MSSSDDVSTAFHGRRAVRSLLSASSAAVSVPLRSLKTEVTCAVCLGIIRECAVVIACLHRFCGDCIADSLRFGKRECPTCRLPCPSRRHLRADPLFDRIVNIIYDDIDGAEKRAEEEVEEIIRSDAIKQFATSALTGVRRQNERAAEIVAANAINKRQTRTQRKRNDDDKNAVTFSLHIHHKHTLADSATDTDTVTDTADKIPAALLPRFQLNKLHYRSPAAVTIALIRKLIQLKLNRQSVDDVVAGAEAASLVGVDDISLWIDKQHVTAVALSVYDANIKRSASRRAKEDESGGRDGDTDTLMSVAETEADIRRLAVERDFLMLPTDMTIEYVKRNLFNKYYSTENEAAKTADTNVATHNAQQSDKRRNRLALAYSIAPGAVQRIIAATVEEAAKEETPQEQTL